MRHVGFPDPTKNADCTSKSRFRNVQARQKNSHPLATATPDAAASSAIPGSIGCKTRACSSSVKPTRNKYRLCPPSFLRGLICAIVSFYVVEGVLCCQDFEERSESQGRVQRKWFYWSTWFRKVCGQVNSVGLDCSASRCGFPTFTTLARFAANVALVLP